MKIAVALRSVRPCLCCCSWCSESALYCMFFFHSHAHISIFSLLCSVPTEIVCLLQEPVFLCDWRLTNNYDWTVPSGFSLSWTKIYSPFVWSSNTDPLYSRLPETVKSFIFHVWWGLRCNSSLKCQSSPRPSTQGPGLGSRWPHGRKACFRGTEFCTLRNFSFTDLYGNSNLFHERHQGRCHCRATGQKYRRFNYSPQLGWNTKHIEKDTFCRSWGRLVNWLPAYRTKSKKTIT